MYLEASRDALTRRANVCRNMFYPMRELPPELLTRIFVDCLDSDKSVISGVQRRHTPLSGSQIFTSPWTLAQVCRLCRTVAMSSPRIWAHIDLDMDLVCPYQTCNPSILDAHIKLAGNVPLSVKFLSADVMPSNDILNKECLAAVDLKRLDELRLEKRGLPFLQRLTVIIWDEWWSNSESSPLHAFTNAPRLKEFKSFFHPHNYEYFLSDKFNLLSTLPLSQLTQSSLCMAIEHRLLFLEQARNIVECVIIIGDVQGTLARSLDSLKRIELPMICRLHLQVTTVLRLSRQLLSYNT